MRNIGRDSANDVHSVVTLYLASALWNVDRIGTGMMGSPAKGGVKDGAVVVRGWDGGTGSQLGGFHIGFTHSYLSHLRAFRTFRLYSQ